MKKHIALLLVFALLFGMTACSSGPKPEDTVKKFFEATKTLDFETMSACCEEGFNPEEIISQEEEDLTGLMDYLKGNAAEIKYTLGKAEVNGEKAVVPVNVEYVDASEVLGETFANFFVELFSMIFSDPSDEDMSQAFADCLSAAIESKETRTTAADIKFDMDLVDGQWLIADMPKEMADVMTSNMLTAMENMGDIFSGEDSDWSMGQDPVEYPISDAVLMDSDIAVMTIQSGGADEWGNINFNVLCENKTDKDLTFRMEDLVVNGWAMGGSLYQDVPAGQSSVGTMDIWASDMEHVGLETPDRVTANVQIYNEEDWWNDVYLVNENYSFYPTEMADGQITVPERPTAGGEIVLADDDNFTMILLDSQTDEMWGGFSIRTYIKNKTDRKLYVDWEDVLVNGIELDPYYGTTVPAGQQAMSEISFAVNEMEELGIETVEKVEFTLRAMDDASGDMFLEQAMTYEP